MLKRRKKSLTNFMPRRTPRRNHLAIKEKKSFYSKWLDIFYFFWEPMDIMLKALHSSFNARAIFLLSQIKGFLSFFLVSYTLYNYIFMAVAYELTFLAFTFWLLATTLYLIFTLYIYCTSSFTPYDPFHASGCHGIGSFGYAIAMGLTVFCNTFFKTSLLILFPFFF